MFVTKKRLLEEVRKAKLEGIAEGKQNLERQVEMSKERGIKEGYNRGFTDRTNYYTMSVIPELEGKIMALEFKLEESEKGKYDLADKIVNKNDDLQELEMYIRQLEEEQKKHKETIANYEVANKSLREIGERLMFRVSELKEEKESIENNLAIAKYMHEINIKSIDNLRKIARTLEEEKEELELNNDLYDFQEIKRLEALMKKVKRVKVKKKIQSRIDKLMIRGL